MFTADGYADGPETIKLKCMPNSYPNAVSAIDAIYKAFSQMYIHASKEGTLNHFVCDFLQDENGRFFFVKISDFSTDGKPTYNHEWKVSTTFVKKNAQFASA